MATVAYSKVHVPYQGECHLWRWVITGSDDGAPACCPHLPIKSVQIYGTFGGGTFAIQGADDADTPTYAVLTDEGGTSLTALGAATIRKVRENSVLVRPVCTGVTSLTIFLLALGYRPMGAS